MGKAARSRLLEHSSVELMTRESSALYREFLLGSDVVAQSFRPAGVERG
jgi:hypothetical protein